MSDYTPSGNPVNGTLGDAAELIAELALIQTAIASKANSASPTLTTPTLGVATATSINKITLTQPATGATLTILDGKTLTVNHSITLAGTDSTTMTFPATSATIARTDAAQTFTGVQDFDGRIDANAGLAVTGANFTSRGITDSATALALTLSGSGANSLTIANSATNPTIGTTAGGIEFAAIVGIGGTAVTTGIMLSVKNATNGNVQGRFHNTGAATTADVLQTGVDVAAGTGYYHYRAYQLLGSAPAVVFSIRGDGALTCGALTAGGAVVLTGQTVGSTVGAAGGASALPATPLGYLTTSINGTSCKIPYYTA